MKKFHNYLLILLIFGILILSGCASTQESASKRSRESVELGEGCTVKPRTEDCTSTEVCVAHMFQRNNYIFDSKEGNACVDYRETIVETQILDCESFLLSNVECRQQNRDIPGGWDPETGKPIYTNKVEFRTEEILPIGTICCAVD